MTKFWPPLIVLAVLQFTHILDFVVLMPLGPQLMREMGLTTAQFGLVVSAYTFSAAITGLVSAFFLDRFDRKTSLLVSYIGFAVGTLFCGLSSGYFLLLIARGVTGAFGGVCASIVLALVGELVPPDKRGLGMGVVMTSFSLASILGVPVGLHMAQLNGWHMPFIVLGALSLVISLLIVLVIPSIRGHLGRVKQLSVYGELKAIVLNRTHLLAYLFSGVLVFSNFVIIPFLSPFMVGNMGFAEHHLALSYFVGGVATLATTTLFGRLSDRYGKKTVFQWIAISSMVPVLLITQSGIVPEWMTLVVAAVFMVLISGRMVPAMAMITSVPSPAQRGGFMSIHSSLQQLSMAGASYVSGVIVTQTATGQLLHFNWVGGISVCCMLISVFLVNRLKGKGVKV